MATELGNNGPGAGAPPIGFLYNTISGKGREDGNLSGSAMDMMGELSVTSQFKVSLHFPFGGISKLERWLSNDGLLGSISEVTTYDFLCSEASLPGAGFNTFEEIGSRQGVREVFASNRQYPTFDMTFYIDTQYKMIRLFEEWMNFINPIYTSTGEKSPNRTGSGYGNAKNRPDFYRLKYPNDYRRILSITKFERDFLRDPTKSSGPTGSNFNNQTTITYRMIDAFPINITSIPVTYESSLVTKSRISFAYSRYVIERNQSESRPIVV
jgi:hypothetical protein